MPQIEDAIFPLAPGRCGDHIKNLRKVLTAFPDWGIL